jgi:DNA-directed RNA polymerase specialized sigma24 family protein
MARLFRELSPRDRVLLWLGCVEGHGPAELAQALGVGKKSVPVLLFRARRRLAKLLRHAGWEG